jgi:hypothetical protein
VPIGRFELADRRTLLLDDVLIGGTIGHLVGRFVLNRHKDESATGNTWMQRARD